MLVEEILSTSLFSGMSQSLQQSIQEGWLQPVRSRLWDSGLGRWVIRPVTNVSLGALSGAVDGMVIGCLLGAFTGEMMGKRLAQAAKGAVSRGIDVAVSSKGQVLRDYALSWADAGGAIGAACGAIKGIWKTIFR